MTGILRGLVAGLRQPPRQTDLIDGVVERCSGFSVGEYEMCLTLVLERHTSAHRGWFKRGDGQIPIELTQSGDQVRYEVDREGHIVRDTFINDTLAARLSSWPKY